MWGVDLSRGRRSIVAGAMLLVVLGLTCCATASGDYSHVGQPQAPANAESVYPVTPLARIETGMHVARVTRIDVDAAEHFLVSGSDDKTVRVWDLATGALLQTLRVPIDDGHVGKIFAVALSPDGSTVAAAGFTGWPGQQIFLSLFDRESGALRRRLGGLDIVNHLAFSRDGRRLAAATHKGLRVYGTTDWKEVFADHDYGGQSYCADFAADGRLVTTSLDGFIRLYGRDLQLLRKQKAPGGERPIFARFSDGTRIAVGYEDTTRVDVLAADDLRLLYQADTKAVENGHLATVAWSADGWFLYAGGGYRDGSGRHLIRRWADGGRGGFADVAVGTNTIMDLKPLRDGGLAVGQFDPLAVLDANDRAIWRKTAEKADFRGQRGQWLFRVSADGQVIRFGFEQGGKRSAEFSFRDLRLVLDPPADPALKGAVTETAGFAVTDWINNEKPKLNGTPLPLDTYEASRSLAIASSGDRFLLGTEWALRLFDGKGREIWKVFVPNVAWGVNISGDGRFALGAFGDGTIRWYDLRDGRELLAFFPHKDGKRWVAWTPEGFFTASRDGESLVGYHLNQGADQAAEFVPVERLYAAYYRPDLLLARLQGDEAKITDALAAIGDVRAVLARGLPPEIELVGSAQVETSSPLFRHEVRVLDRGGGVGRIEYRINDAMVGGERFAEGAPPPGVRSRPLELAPGKNVVETTVYSADGKVASRSIVREVVVNEPKPEQLALYGLIVGIDGYRDGDLALRWAAADAQAVARTLDAQGRELFATRELQVLDDPPGAAAPKATKAGIRAAFAEIAQKARPVDVFVLYLSGHGTVEDGSYYFLPQDLAFTSPQALADGSLSARELQDLINGVKAQKKVVLIDSCNSGAFMEGQQLALDFGGRAWRSGIEMKTAMARLIKATGVAVISASTGLQRAREGYGPGEQKHGVFTFALLRGLAGEADMPETDSRRPDGHITTAELWRYVEETVPKLSKQAWGIEQLPMADIKGQNFSIVAVP